VEENGTVEVGIDLTGASDQATVAIDGLPANTILVSGDDAAVCDGGPVDLTGWNIDYLEISPPPGFEGTIEGEILVSDTGFNGAPVTSASTFSLDVGDAGEAQGEDGSDPLELMSESGSGGGQGDAGWAADAEDEGAGDDDTSDVMSEQVDANEGSEVSAVDTDTYERADW